MKRKLVTLLASAFTLMAAAQQGPGLIISEVLANPAGTDSPFEFVELVATRTINFASTPYTVFASNNGNATTQGWINGGSLTYAFSITTGTVNQGDVVYVGGSSMIATGPVLRSINTGTTVGDGGYGNANSGGVFGNGGSNADGIAVFDVPVASITTTTVPVDALFYGTGLGGAVVNAGVDGYQLPVNDLYPGGKLQSTSFIGPDAGSGQYIVGSGTFNPSTGSFTTGRSWSLTTTFTDNATSIVLSTGTAAASVAFSGTNQTVNENAGTVNVTVNVSNPNNGEVVFTVAALPFSTATYTTDYTQAPVQIVLAAGVSGPQVISIPITDDAIAEKDEYIVLAFTQLYNVTAASNAAYYLYIKDNDTPAPVASNELSLDLLTSFSNGVAGSNSAEIVAHDPTTQRLYIANSVGAKLDILDFANPSAPVLVNSLSITPYGNINSVAVRDGVVAMAIENGTNPQDSGKIVFLDFNGTFISQVNVGAMPDMITFNHAGTKVVAACEGEPNQAYTSDPEGVVAIVDISAGVASVTSANVSFITFTSFNGQENTLRAQGIRIFGPGASASQDFEPEYVTISDDDQTGWVTLQENNAIAMVDFQTNTVIQLIPLGYKNYVSGAAAMDASDQTSGVNLSQFPVYGMYQPDALSHFMIGNQNYIVTANEGDSRDYSGFSEESRISGATLDPAAFPYAAYMKSNMFMGRLNITTKLGDTDNDGDLDQLYSYGGRSFSIWNGTTGAQVYDSGDDLERITSTDPNYSAIFNASNSSSPAPKNRSDDKGPEPEGTAVGIVNGEQYAFIGLERIGGVMIYNVSNPASPVFSGYYNNRDFATNGPDRGAEGIIYIADSLSPNGHALIILANETSSTLSIYQISTCAEKAGIAVTPSSTSPVCAGNNVTLNANTVSNTTYQWYMNGSPIVGETGTSYTATATGDYQLMVTNSTFACSGKTDFVNVTINPLPAVTATSTVTAVCDGASASLDGNGAVSYNWMPGSLSGSTVSVTPSSATTYTVTGTDANGCANTATVAINVNALPSVSATSSVTTVCSGSSAALDGAGASTYDWMPGNLSGSTVTVNPTSATTYTVTGTDANGCVNTATVSIGVNALPVVTASSSAGTVCSGSNVTLSSSGAGTYNWQPNNQNGSSVLINPTSTNTYTVTGTDANGCVNTATVAVTVLPRPNVTASSSIATICSGDVSTLTAGGATTYTWLPGLLTGNPVNVTPASSTTYTVTGSGSNGCTNTATVAIAVNASPSVTATASSTNLCGSSTITLNANGAGSYNWMPVNQNGNSITDTPLASTTYTVTGTAANGCTGSSTVAVTVNTPPVVVFTTPNPDTMCTSGQPVQLNATPSGGTYIGPGITGSMFNPASAGLGNIQLIYSYTDMNGCSGSDTTMAYVDLCTGLAATEANQMQLNVMPNPSNGSFNIQLENVSEETQLTLINELGQIVDHFTVPAGTTSLHVDQLAKGFYILTAENASNRIAQRVVVQ